MADDNVEIIEIYPEVVEISDDEDEGNKDVIVINFESGDDSNGGDSANVITIKEESVKVEAHTDGLSSQEAQPNKTNPLLVRAKKRKRRRPYRGRVNKSTTSASTVQNIGSPNGSHNELSVIKQETESAAETNRRNDTNDNDLQNGSPTRTSNTGELTASSTVIEIESDIPLIPPKKCDYSKISWLKPLNNLSSPPHLQLVIIDRGHPDWKIETNKWLMIEKRLLEKLHTEMLRSKDSSIGLFDGAKWQKGIKVVGCHNKKALNFIKNFILNLDKLWAGAKLDVCTMAYFQRQICKVFIPPPIIKTDVVLSLIKLQNPLICSEDWEVLGERERNRGIDLWLSVNEESLSYLRRSRGEIKYGINRIFLNPVL